jgi:hypothetical protein
MDSDEAVLMKGSNFLVTNPHRNLNKSCAVESIVSMFPQTLGMQFRGKIRSILEKSKSSRPNMTTKELKTMKSLRLKRLNKDPSGKGNYAGVFDESKYRDKLTTFLESGVYELCPKILELG